MQEHLGAKTDRELLLLTAQGLHELCNKIDILNGNVQSNRLRIEKHEGRLLILETTNSVQTEAKVYVMNKNHLVGVVVGLIIAGISLVYGIGAALNWWTK